MVIGKSEFLQNKEGLSSSPHLVPLLTDLISEGVLIDSHSISGAQECAVHSESLFNTKTSQLIRLCTSVSSNA